jgi:hypothetical protein
LESICIVTGTVRGRGKDACALDPGAPVWEKHGKKETKKYAGRIMNKEETNVQGGS